MAISKISGDMVHNLECVFKRFEENGPELEPRKCQLFKLEVEILGHIVNGFDVSTDPKKTECIKQWPTPIRVTEVPFIFRSL